MITENPIKWEYPAARGWIVYDADCALCVRAMQSVRRLFESRGFRWRPLQTPGSAALLGVQPSAFDTRMHVLTRNGAVFHNADALGVLCRSVWWLWPLGVVLLVPGFRGLGRVAYDWLARNRYCLGGLCDVSPITRTSACSADWIPAAERPVLALALTGNLRPYLTSRWRRLGYHATNIVFGLLPIIYGCAALKGVLP